MTVSPASPATPMRSAQFTMPVSTPAAPDRGFPVWMRLLEAATREVFEAMIGEPASPAVYAEDDRPPVADFTALVGLSGALCGSLSIRCQSDTAYEMGARMLGGEIDGHDEFVADALGELANMIAGNFKSKIPGLADACRMSVPTVFHGTELTQDLTARGELLESCFLFHGMPFWVSLDLWPEGGREGA